MASYTISSQMIPPSKMTWKKSLLLTMGVMGGLFVLAGILFAIFQPIKVLPRIRLAPGFAMIDQNGDRLTNEALRGQIVLYNFTYTRCSETCEGMNNTVQEIINRVENIDMGGVPFTLVTISFDPEFDSPEVLNNYAASLGADLTYWHFATLDDPALLKTIIGGGFEAYYEPQADGTFKFSPTFVLVDGWGIVRGQYRYETITPNSERIARHVGVLVEEVQKSIGAARFAYEAAHLFLCYAP